MATLKINISFVSDAIYPYHKGGKEKRLYELTTRLAKKGHDIHIYCMKWWQGPGDKTENGIKLHAISKYHMLYSGEKRSILQALAFGLACLKLIKKEFDILDVDHMPYFPLFSTKIVCFLKRKKMMATWNEVWGKEYWREYLGFTGIIGYMLERLTVFMPHEIISISGYTTNKLENDLGVKKKIHTVPIGIDFERIQKVNTCANESDIIFAGRLIKHKNIDLLVDSIRLIKQKRPGIRCLIIGDGPERRDLEALVKKLDLGKNIFFLGFLDNHDLVCALMKSSKVFFLPSTREGFGTVVIEANACGIPVVVIDHKDNAAKDLIRDGENGLICGYNPEVIADRIILLLDMIKHNNIKNVCKESAKIYDWNNIVNRIEQVYLRWKNM